MSSNEEAGVRLDDKLIQTPRGKEVVLARHPKRPYTLDYAARLFESYLELHGDRVIGDSKAIISGVAQFEGLPVAFAGHQKGRTTQERVARNFGASHPEGYRKAVRIMKFAALLHNPTICFIDTPAAACDVAAESRGIATAIATSMVEMFRIPSPIVAVVIGEGGSGGAIGLSVADRILMLQHSVYSVIPPEGCANILWRDPEKRGEAAEALKLTAQDAFEQNLIDEVITEPRGGAHLDYDATAASVGEAILRHLAELREVDQNELVTIRRERFRKIGSFNS